MCLTANEIHSPDDMVRIAILIKEMALSQQHLLPNQRHIAYTTNLGENATAFASTIFGSMRSFITHASIKSVVRLAEVMIPEEDVCFEETKTKICKELKKKMLLAACSEDFMPFFRREFATFVEKWF